MSSQHPAVRALADQLAQSPQRGRFRTGDLTEDEAAELERQLNLAGYLVARRWVFGVHVFGYAKARNA